MGLGSILGKIGKGVLNVATGGVSGGIADILGAGGAALGGAAHDSAQNRDAQYAGQIDLASILANRDLALQHLRADAGNDFFNQTIARNQEGRAERDDSWRKLLSAQHTLSPSAMPNVSPYSVPQRQATGMERQGADALTQEVMARLQGGNTLPQVQQRTPTLDYDPMSTIDPRLLKAPAGERISNILGPALSFLGRPKQVAG